MFPFDESRTSPPDKPRVLKFIPIDKQSKLIFAFTLAAMFAMVRNFIISVVFLLPITFPPSIIKGSTRYSSWPFNFQPRINPVFHWKFGYSSTSNFAVPLHIYSWIDHIDSYIFIHSYFRQYLYTSNIIAAIASCELQGQIPHLGRVTMLDADNKTCPSGAPFTDMV